MANATPINTIPNLFATPGLQGSAVNLTPNRGISARPDTKVPISAWVNPQPNHTNINTGIKSNKRSLGYLQPHSLMTGWLFAELGESGC